MKASAIIQARMSSSRLHGKIMMEVLGKPLIGYMIERLQLCKKVEKIIIATSTDESNDNLCEYLRGENIDIFRGSEDDVLDRFMKAAIEYKIDPIIRMTADCPLIDPKICDQVVEEYFNSGVDFVHTGSTFAEGLDCEIFSFSSLEKSWYDSNLESEREHLTLYMHNHPELFTKKTLVNEIDDSGFRFTVDEEVDFLVVKTIIENLYNKGNKMFNTEDIKRFLNTHPEIFKINANIIRNEGLLISLAKEKKDE